MRSIAAMVSLVPLLLAAPALAADEQTGRTSIALLPKVELHPSRQDQPNEQLLHFARWLRGNDAAAHSCRACDRAADERALR